MNDFKRIEYGYGSDFINNPKEKEQTEIRGILNYRLRSIYIPVLDRKHINEFNPEKTCISVCGNKEFEFDESRLIEQAIRQVKRLKDYYLYNKNEHIGESNIFQGIEVDELMLESYSFGLDSEGEYYLILWFTPHYLFNGKRKHVYWYGKKHGGGWY